MLIRELEKQDIPEVLQLTAAMHRESPFYNKYAYSEQKVLDLTNVFLTNEDWFCVVAEHNDRLVGFMAVTIIPTFFGFDNFVEDVSFFVEPVSRGTSAAIRLVRAVEVWALSRGAETIRCGVTTGVREDGAHSFFIKLGYENTGQLYTKLISPLNSDATR
jgi:GNAT superfamily N-acetyltransferase